MTSRLVPRTETVTSGTTTIGKVRVTERGFECFGPKDQYLCTFATIESARRALFDMHKSSDEARV